MLVDNTVFLIGNAVVTGTLIAQLLLPAIDQRHLFSNGQHGFRVHLNAPDRLGIGAAPIEVYPPVIIPEKVRIPESKGCRYFLEFLVQRLFGAQNGTVHIPAGSAKIQVISHLPHVRRVIINQQIGRCMEFPVQKILAVPEARAHGYESVIGALEENQGGVSALPVGKALSLVHVRVSIAQVKGIAVRCLQINPHLSFGKKIQNLPLHLRAPPITIACFCWMNSIVHIECARHRRWY